MRELVCIVCPRGCKLVMEEKLDGSLDIRGNACARGPVWATSEIRDPRRTVTATCRLLPSAHGAPAPAAGLEARTDSPRRLPVRSTAPCPRPLVEDLLADIYRLELHSPVAAGQILIANWRDLGFDVVATADG